MSLRSLHTSARPALVLAALAASACATVGPDYKRPAVETPGTFRGEAGPPAPGASLGDEPWTALFTDPALQDLIATALRDSFDVRIAASRILQAEAQYGITHSAAFPTVSAEAAVQGQRSSLTSSSGEAKTGGAIQLGGRVSWMPDFWGKFRRASEAARADILATEWGQRAVKSTLVAQVAGSYFALRALDLELSIAERTLASRQESLRLTQVRESGGVTSLVDVRQAEQLVYGATAQIASLRGLIVQQENLLSVLVGHYPDAIPRGKPLTDQPHTPAVPSGLPSALRERRPDIRQAEAALAAANAGIGVARADYFPQIGLTGSGGVASTALATLVSGAGLGWTAAASVAQPVFTAGRTRSQVALAEARRDEAELSYRQSIQLAFRDVADALSELQRSRELRAAQEQLLASAQDARRLAEIRYQGGASSYLEVLDSDTRLFDAELSLVNAQLGELGAYVGLYQALGGGWQE
jgi:multidrug efflux system outer membrane protein